MGMSCAVRKAVILKAGGCGDSCGVPEQSLAAGLGQSRALWSCCHQLCCSRRFLADGASRVSGEHEHSVTVELLLCQTPARNRLVGLEIMRSVIVCLASYEK